MNEYNEIQKEQELIEQAERETFRELNGFSDEEEQLIGWKNVKMMCPICDNETTEHRRIYMEHSIVEEHVLCKDEHHIYSFKYLAGNFEEQIGGVIFHNYNADSEEDIKLFEEVLKRNREGYKKKLMHN